VIALIVVVGYLAGAAAGQAEARALAHGADEPDAFARYRAIAIARRTNLGAVAVRASIPRHSPTIAHWRALFELIASESAPVEESTPEECKRPQCTCEVSLRMPVAF